MEKTNEVCSNNMLLQEPKQQRENNNNNNVNNNRCNIFSNDAEIEMSNEEDTAQIMKKEEINTMKKECSQEQERVKF